MTRPFDKNFSNEKLHLRLLCGERKDGVCSFRKILRPSTLSTFEPATFLALSNLGRNFLFEWTSNVILSKWFLECLSIHFSSSLIDKRRSKFKNKLDNCALHWWRYSLSLMFCYCNSVQAWPNPLEMISPQQHYCSTKLIYIQDFKSVVFD